MSPIAPIMSSWIWPRNIGGWRSGYLMNYTINCISVVVVTMWNSFYSLIFCVLSLWLRLCESETVVLLLFSSFSPSRLASQGLLSLEHPLVLVCQLFLSCSRAFWKLFGLFLRVSLWSSGTTLVLLACKLIVWSVHQWVDFHKYSYVNTDSPFYSVIFFKYFYSFWLKSLLLFYSILSNVDSIAKKCRQAK